MEKIAAEEPVANGPQGVSKACRCPQRQGIAAGREQAEKQSFGVKRKERRGQERRAEQGDIRSEQTLMSRLKRYAG